ncbi:MAG: ABC transporter substrate-binding protein [Acidimicrobiales bacterium]
MTVDYAGLQDVKGYNTGSPGAQVKAIVDYLNRQGGIAGRKIELVVAKFPATTNNIAAEEQAMCATFTEDHKVFAVVYGLVTEGRALVPCLARHNVPLINSGGGGLADERFMAEHPSGYFMPGSMNLSRLARAYIDGLADQGFFGATSRIGLVRVDDDPFKRATDQIVRPHLAARGLKLDAEAVVSAQTSLGSTALQMPNIVLRFQQSGINRVLFLDNAMLAPLFAIQAAGQGYYPRYGLNSLTLPDTMNNNVPSIALRGAAGVGWQAGLDVAAGNDDSPRNAAIDTCTAIMSRAGLSGVDRTGQWQQRLYCDELFFLRDSLKGAADITPAALAARVAALGTSYQSAETFATRFFPGRQDGTAQVRFFAFNDACSCFRYTSPPRTAG